MGHHVQSEKAFHHHQASKLSEEVLSPRANRNMKLQDKSKGLKSQRPLEQRSSDHLSTRSRKDDHGTASPLTASCHNQKRCPSKKAIGVDELVKHMSSVPCYLQCSENGEKVQERALNVGVLDWRRLEKWTNKQNCSPNGRANGRAGSSPSTSNAPSPFSTFASSDKSFRSTSSPLSGKKQSHGLYGQWKSSVDGGQTWMRGFKSSVPTMASLDSQTSAISGAHHGLLDADCNSSGDSLAKKHGKCKGKESNVNVILSGMSNRSHIGSSPLTSRTDEILACHYDDVRAEHTRLTEAEKCRSYEEGNCSNSLHLVKDSLQDQHIAVSQNTEGLLEDLEPNVCDSSVSCESLKVDEEKPVEINRKSFQEESYFGDECFDYLPSHVPLSCPLPFINQRDETDTASNLFYASEVSVTTSQAKLEESWRTTSSNHELVDCRVTDANFDKRKPSVTGRGLSPSRRSIAGWNWMSRSSSLRGASPFRQMKATTCSDNTDGDKTSAGGRGRRSPLRRILDPLLKPKNHVASGSIPSSLIPHAYEASSTNKHLLRTDQILTNAAFSVMDNPINCSIGSVKTKLNSASQVTMDTGVSTLQCDGQSKSPKQALLQLAWKNGLPLFMFSTAESDILAATMRKNDIFENHDSQSVYTIFSVHELKKKSGAWMNQVSKSKKQELFSNVVAQVKLSCSKAISYESKGHVVKEFVLFGSDRTPTSHEPVDSTFDTELAAIVITAPMEMTENCSGGILHSRNCKDLMHLLTHHKCSSNQEEKLQFETNAEALSAPGIVAILPSGVHGSSTQASPSPLIKRWKSGGVCDCGGWDEGCMLSVLTDKLPDSRSTPAVQVCHATDGNQRVELFVKAGAHKKGLAFSMVAFKEGLYAVDFRAPVGSLQAFAICIAKLHGRIPCHYGVPISMETRSSQDHGFADHKRDAKTQGETHMPSVPSHPPLSPIGRA